MKPSRTTLGALLPALAVLAVYGASIGYEFVYDDHVQIERNPWLRDPRGVWLFFTRPFWGFYMDRGSGPSNYYRPVFGIFYSLVARAFGLQPAAYHAASVALHLAVTLLVALGARRLLPGRRGEIAALAAGLLFAVYPAHAEAVAWVGDQVDPLTALFALPALYSYLSRKDRGEWAGWAGPLCYLLACLAKEPGTALLLVLGAVEAAEWRREGTLGAFLRRASGRLLPYLAVFGVYVVLRLHALGSFSPRSYGVTASPVGAVAFAGGLFARYLAFLFVPFPARVLASVPAPTLRSPVAIAGLAALGLVLLGLLAAAWSGRARREVFLPLALMVAFLLPVLAVNSIGGSNFSERYLYIPSIGLAWLFGLLASRLAEVLPGPARKPAMAAGLALLAALGIAAGLRAEIYRSDLNLFRAAVRTAPNSEIARNNLGMALYNRGHISAAEREYQKALRLDPRAVPPLANLAVLYEKRGEIPRAEKTFEEVLRLSSTHTISAVHLARLQRKRGDRAGAVRRLDALFAAGGESYDALVERADLWLEEHRPDKAVPLLERAVRTFPEYAKGWGLLARARAETGDGKGAAEAARRALEIDPKNGEARGVLGRKNHQQSRALGLSGDWGGLPSEASPPGPLSTKWRGGNVPISKTLIFGPSLSTKWRGTEGEASEGRTARGRRALQDGSPAWPP
ncbi:MAG: tetratricopeptide repeat protein [Thermoanaerobaculia bacterium]